MSRKVRIWDFMLILGLLLLCCGGWLFPSSSGAEAEVSVDGRILAVLPLDTDTVFALPDGTQVIVEDDSVRVEGATCGDKLCQSMGRISRAGETVLCLPNRISVVISGEVDAYVG